MVGKFSASDQLMHHTFTTETQSSMQRVKGFVAAAAVERQFSLQLPVASHQLNTKANTDTNRQARQFRF